MLARRGTRIDYRDGEDVVRAYLSTPHVGHGAGVLVVHDSWGFGEFIRDVCDRLARADFVALAPDLFGAEPAESSAQADRLAVELDTGRAVARLDAGLTELLNQPETDAGAVGVLGFGIGGPLALELACRSARVGAVVELDARHGGALPECMGLRAPVLALFAGGDPDVDAALVTGFEARLKQAGQRCSVQARAGVRAGFMDDSRPDVHDAVAEFEAWDLLLRFLRAELP